MTVASRIVQPGNVQVVADLADHSSVEVVWNSGGYGMQGSMVLPIHPAMTLADIRAVAEAGIASLDAAMQVARAKYPPPDPDDYG
ncbi:hypothetical protein [Ferrovibrio sp.]|uniref:hypothetical protein n=1 Tax=Ferrovibrio sp. TaxID=1917215 RepID=UPI003D0AE19F